MSPYEAHEKLEAHVTEGDVCVFHFILGFQREVRGLEPVVQDCTPKEAPD